MDLSSLKSMLGGDFAPVDTLTLILGVGGISIVVLLVLLKIAFVSMNRIDAAKAQEVDPETE